MEPDLSPFDDRLVGICRSPVHCPVSACHQMVGVTSVLTHFLRDHRPAMGYDFQEICADQRSLLVFNYRNFRRNVTCDVGVLVYAGQVGAEAPAETGLCRANSFLPERFGGFVNHLPILILACRTPAVALLADGKYVATAMYDGARGGDEDDEAEEDSEVLVLWLATVETTRPLHCTITVFSADMCTSRSCIVPVRSLTQSQNPVDFLSTESAYLMITSGERRLLRFADTGNIELEIFVHEMQ